MELEVTDARGRAADPIADTPERAQLRAEVRRLIERESPPERVRELAQSNLRGELTPPDDEPEILRRLHRRLARFYPS